MQTKVKAGREGERGNVPKANLIFLKKATVKNCNSRVQSGCQENTVQQDRTAAGEQAARRPCRITVLGDLQDSAKQKHR